MSPQWPIHLPAPGGREGPLGNAHAPLVVLPSQIHGHSLLYSVWWWCVDRDVGYVAGVSSGTQWFRSISGGGVNLRLGSLLQQQQQTINDVAALYNIPVMDTMMIALVCAMNGLLSPYDERCQLCSTIGTNGREGGEFAKEAALYYG